MPHPARTRDIIANEAHDFSKAIGFSGSVDFTGTQTEPVSVVNTSAFTLRTSAHSGKTLLLTTAAGSRHKRLTLPKTSLMTSGFFVRIVNGMTALSSGGISLIATSLTKINGSSKVIISTTRILKGATVTIVKVNNTYWALNAHAGATVPSSLAWTQA